MLHSQRIVFYAENFSHVKRIFEFTECLAIYYYISNLLMFHVNNKSFD